VHRREAAQRARFTPCTQAFFSCSFSQNPLRCCNNFLGPLCHATYSHLDCDGLSLRLNLPGRTDKKVVPTSDKKVVPTNAVGTSHTKGGSAHTKTPKPGARNLKSPGQLLSPGTSGGQRLSHSGLPHRLFLSWHAGCAVQSRQLSICNEPGLAGLVCPNRLEKWK
jgi:hypothetical protein